MIYIFGVNILKKKKLIIGLTTIYGIGYHHAKFICKGLGLTENICVYQLTDKQLFKINRFLINLNLKTGLSLKQQIINLEDVIYESTENIRKIQKILKDYSNKIKKLRN